MPAVPDPAAALAAPEHPPAAALAPVAPVVSGSASVRGIAGVTARSEAAAPAAGFPYPHRFTVWAAAAVAAACTAAVAVATTVPPEEAAAAPATPAATTLIIGLGSPGQAPQIAITYQEVPTAPAITSAASTTFVAGTPGTFTVTTTGFPLPSLSGGKGLPPGVTFSDNGDGTASLAYDGSASALGTSPITISASNGVAPDATQHFSVIMARPAAPTGLSATPGSSNTKNALSWNPVTGATSYNVLRSTTSGGPYTRVAVVPATSMVNGGLTPGTTYYYVVAATVAGVGSSVNSTEASATTLSTPVAPVVNAATASSTSIQVSWNAVTATGSTGPTTYNVYSSTTAGGPYTLKAVLSTLSWPNNGLTPGTTYYYVVKAVVPGVGSSPNSVEASATTLAAARGPRRECSHGVGHLDPRLMERGDGHGVDGTDDL